MEPRSLKYVAEACAGECQGPGDREVRAVCTDSRRVAPGDLFVALRGERHDGHDFAGAAARAGAGAALLARDCAGLPPDFPVIRVADTRRALGQLAARYREDFEPAMVAVAGSNGKTTTKELLAAVLRQRWTVLASEASFNNDIGVPLTLLKLERRHQAAVIEMGTNHPGELAPLVRLARPRLGLLTMIGREHLEHFGDLEGVAEEEGWLAELLPADGRLIVNGDHAWMQRAISRSRAPVVRTGLGGTNDWRAANLRPDEQGVRFTVTGPRRELAGEYRVNLLGRHQVNNALLALAAAAELGLSRAEIARGLADCPALRMRMQVEQMGGIRILNDAYNANADSTAAALETLAGYPCSGRRVAVLGDLAELGRHTEEAHREIGQKAATLGVDWLVAVGRMAATTATAAREAGLRQARDFAELESAAAALKGELRPGDAVLLKASRAARLERLLEYWAAEKPPPKTAASQGENL